jgi:hypothetical protein
MVLLAGAALVRSQQKADAAEVTRFGTPTRDITPGSGPPGCASRRR